MTRTIIAVFGFAIAIAVFFFYTKPTYDNAQSLQASIGEYNQALEKAAELQSVRQALLSRYNAFNPADIDRLHRLLPDHVDNVRLVLDLDNIAQRYGLALQNVVVGSAQGTTATAVSAIGGDQAYDSLTFKFATEGTYENFVRFMGDLERSLRIVDLVALSMSGTGGPQTGGDPTYRFDITVKTYWLK